MDNPTSKVEALRRALLDPAEVEATMAVVALTPDVTPEMLAEIEADYRARCTDICTAMEDLTFEGDESEAEKHIPLTWLALRYEWSRCNDQMQYQTIIKGQADTRTMAHGSMLSKIAEKLEGLQTRQELFWTLKLAADPFGTVGRIPTMARRLMSVTASAGRAVGEVLQEFNAARDLVGSVIEDRDVLDKIDKSLSRSIECVDRNVGIELDDLHAALEAELVERLADAGVTALIELRNPDGSQLIPPDVSDLFFALARLWFEHLFTHSIEPTPEDREKSGKNAHVTLGWRIERDERKLSFILEDDGLGAAGFAVPRDALAPGLQVRQSHDPGLGSKLVVESNFMLSGNAEYLSFSVHNGRDCSTLAVPAQYVSFIELVDAARLASAANLLSTSSGDYYPVLDTSLAVFGARADYERNLVVFADLGDAGRVALRANEIHGITRGRVRPLPFDAGGHRVAGVLNTSGDLVMVLDIEEMLSS
ncbi:chemotaxis protein CheW [Erythrobacter sp.]|uniref:chemotaxis protein CheW n=1 Tax=Erythrobacter sp. TaxID=1042 RepID=UPI001425D9FE|nr:chemotaxis protein CheW [Erythrobacter sp.]QIQ86708.1 MAG: hypothetical protein G9473_08430 [Erythrobacter sp.]